MQVQSTNTLENNVDLRKISSYKEFLVIATIFLKIVKAGTGKSCLHFATHCEAFSR